ncbi:general transcription factor II-I repeat domain-containing protein 2-like [Octopus bimaculoides]|uniref:general transcription factor II-I repeat domain-containing protein 2-like n=1 Tax=Octopus bimaculoides TaxID=37653 RepID=UPI00071D8B90|nr:general transcription factor II-I repeat domain-containing protein 2-like [Octopus bimaculoides]|eukprot:XP_014776676.1 PREDICTED: general transcription factor II-I repeat domain-containing protein 2-like [Octopus bimaculoides]
MFMRQNNVKGKNIAFTKILKSTKLVMYNSKRSFQEILLSKITLEVNENANSNFATIHCIIHQENLCAKSLKFENVKRVVVSTINFIKSQALNHHQFKEFLEELELEYGDLVYYCAVCWLSKEKMLQRFYSLREAVCTFLERNGKFVPELKNDNWICDLAFLVDITTHLNDLNLKLQKQNQLIHEMYSRVKAFQAKLQIWENQLRIGDAFHFPTLAIHESTSRYDDSAVKLSELKKRTERQV